MGPPICRAGADDKKKKQKQILRLWRRMTTKKQRQKQNRGSELVLAVAGFDGVEEFGGVVADAVFEDDFYFFYVGDVGGGVAVDDDEVGVFAGGDGADFGLLA